MCGIFFCSSNNGTCQREYWNMCKNVICARGPDSYGEIKYSCSPNHEALFCASVLWLRGPKPVQQPLIDCDGNILLWNGDVFGGPLFVEESCDSEVILDALRESNDIPSTIRKIIGPFSFIYFRASEKFLYFARDTFGRHSLLMKFDPLKSLIITSVAVKNLKNISEVPAVGIFKADLNKDMIEFSLYPWLSTNDSVINNFKEFYPTSLNIIRTENISQIRESFFFNENADLEGGFLKYNNDIGCFETPDEIMKYLLNQECILEKVDKLSNILNDSVRKRTQLVPRYCKNCTKQSSKNVVCEHAKIGVLFSGGLDSTILATLAHINVNPEETIDLINIAFEDKSSNYEPPDRITGRDSMKELTNVCKGRNFNFIEVNISREELQMFRTSCISDLSSPLFSVLDESLACAIWFASRGKGYSDSLKSDYESSCRILLLGMGADEQFGGYMRHRTTLQRKGWMALYNELNFDFDRIAERNCGRDDRMVADHGRQSRLPYLDENLVEFIQNLAPWERCYPVKECPPGIGDKLLLRLLARKLGLYKVAKFPKRAIQFGSRIANKKENAREKSKYL